MKNTLTKAPMDLIVTTPLGIAGLDLEPDDASLTIVSAMRQFRILIETGQHPKCLTCDYTWTTFGDLPALLSISMTPDHVVDDVAFDDATMMTSGICRSCASKFEIPELRMRILNGLRKIWPDMQMSGFSDKPETKQ